MRAFELDKNNKYSWKERKKDSYDSFFKRKNFALRGKNEEGGEGERGREMSKVYKL